MFSSHDTKEVAVAGINSGNDRRPISEQIIYEIILETVNEITYGKFDAPKFLRYIGLPCENKFLHGKCYHNTMKT
jgi:hypothetical protein